jgi:hypothetical protein
MACSSHELMLFLLNLQRCMGAVLELFAVDRDEID